MRTILSILAAAAIGAAAVSPLAAQQAVAANVARPVVPSAAAPRTVATYRIVAVRDRAMPAEVTLADSAGTLVASYRMPYAREAQPMLVSLIDADLVLQGETPAGVFTLQLRGINEVEGPADFTGRWWLGEQSGELRGRTAR